MARKEHGEKCVKEYKLKNIKMDEVAQMKKTWNVVNLEIKKYIEYSKEQEESFKTIEYQKEEFKNAYFNEKDNKEEMPLLYNSISK